MQKEADITVKPLHAKAQKTQRKRSIHIGPGKGVVPPLEKIVEQRGADNETFPIGLPVGGLRVTHGGGAVIQRPKVQLLFWGNAWNSQPQLDLAGQVTGACQQILRGHYLDEMRQYGTGGSGAVVGSNLVLADPPNPCSQDDVGNKVWDLIDQGHFPDPHDSPGPNFYVVFLPPGVMPASTDNGAHFFADDTDWFDTARVWLAWIRFGSLDFLTSVFSHELVEFCSDPDGAGWQVEPRDETNWHEIVDVCQGASDRLDGIQVAAYYSMEDKACIIPQNPLPPPPPPTLPNGRYRVSCIEHAANHPYILAIGGELPNGSHWMMWEDDAFPRVERGELSFYVSGGGKTADLMIEVSYFGYKYFKTIGDDTLLDNLATLPGCDSGHSVRFI